MYRAREDDTYMYMHAHCWQRNEDAGVDPLATLAATHGVTPGCVAYSGPIHDCCKQA